MITANALREMSERRGEPGWIREARLESARRFHDLAAPTWGGGLSGLDFGDVVLDKVGLDGIDAVIGAHSDASGQATREEADAVARRIAESPGEHDSADAPLRPGAHGGSVNAYHFAEGKRPGPARIEGRVDELQGRPR